MKLTLILAVVVALMFAAVPSHAATCKNYRTCAEAVKEWCAGRHKRADRDRDGIPCENVCRSVKQVKAEIKRAGITCAP